MSNYRHAAFFLWVLAVPAAGQQSHFPDCFHSEREGGYFSLRDHADCSADKLGLASNLWTKQALVGLALNPDDVRFIGCDGAPFSTQPVRLASSLKVLITYPTDSGLAPNDFMGPIVHELGHAFQLRRAGSPRAAIEKDGSIERVELGADFICGYLAGRVMKGFRARQFQQSLMLVGSYDMNQNDNHGRPEDRTGAFRYGLNYASRDPDIALQYDAFQQDFYSILKGLS